MDFKSVLKTPYDIMSSRRLSPAEDYSHPDSRMVGYNLSIRDFSSCPEEVSQGLTIGVGKGSAYGVDISRVRTCGYIPKFYPHGSSLKTGRESWLVKRSEFLEIGKFSRDAEIGIHASLPFPSCCLVGEFR